MRSGGWGPHDGVSDLIRRDLRELGSSFCSPPMALLKGVLNSLTLCRSLRSLYVLVVAFLSQDVMLAQTWVCIELRK